MKYTTTFETYEKLIAGPTHAEYIDTWTVAKLLP
jgi:hypothetical protein